MCLIIRTEKEKEITKQVMNIMAARNNDGYGFMWIQDNKIHAIKKNGMNLDELYDKYLELKEFNPFIHLRMRTHGDLDVENAHPYFCGYGIWLMHNGIISHSSINSKDSKSDTWQFIDNILNPLFKQTKNPHRLIRSEMFKILTEQFLGSSNKIVIGDRGGFVLIHENSWFTVPDYVPNIGGILVSNSYAWDYSSCKPKKRHLKRTKKNEDNKDNISVYNEIPFKTHGFDLKIIGGKFFIDSYGKIWYYNGYGYIRRRDLDEYSLEELQSLLKLDSEITNKTLNKLAIEEDVLDNKEKEKVNPSTNIVTDNIIQTEIYFPQPKSVIMLNNEDYKIEVEEEVDKQLKEFDETEMNFICKEWNTYPDEDLETLLWTEPEETLKVLKHCLRRY